MILKTLKYLVIGLIVVLLAAAVWFNYEFRKQHSPAEEKIIFTVEKGANVRTVARDLVGEGLMAKSWPFVLGYRFFYSEETIKAGEYAFSPPFSAKDILTKILEGEVNLYPVTIIEGLTRREIAAHLNAAVFLENEDFLEASSNREMIADLDPLAENLEGYLFPETYHFPQNTPSDVIVREMVAHFKKVFTPEWKRQASKLGLSIRETVILASLIEKETSVNEEKPVVSGVFHNRLRIGMKLDCDPTIIYGLKEEGRFDGNLRKRDLSWDSPYNTYVHSGLPPGPIANPGKDSIQAALYPAEVDFLYFVSKNDGSHQFSATYSEHLKAVNFYQKNRR